MRILCIIFSLLLLLTPEARADKRPFVSDSAQAEYLKALSFSGISLNASTDEIIEHFKSQGYSNIKDKPLALNGRNVIMRTPASPGGSVTIVDAPLTGVRTTTINVRSLTKSKTWRDMPYGTDLQNIVDTLCDGEIEDKISKTDPVHCSESIGTLYIFARVTNDSGVKYRLNITAMADAMLNVYYYHD